MTFSRRSFVRRFGQASVTAWLGAAWIGTETTLDALAAPEVPASVGTERGVLRATFLATRLDAMQAFYGRTMGWPVARVGTSLRVQTGGTELLFEPTPEDDTPYYHLAWAIPSNKFELGKAWLAKRLPLLRHPDGREEFHFTTARRRAVYFADPAGNILELIARDDLGDHRDGPFSLADLLYVNHVGLVVADMMAAIRNISQSLGLQPTAPPRPTFTKLGDVHRHVVLVPQDRLWLPEMNRGAEVFGAEVVLHGPQPARMELAGHPYRIEIAS